MNLSLNDSKEGKCFTLKSISSELRASLIRLGLCEGDTVKCIANIPGGPVVVEKGLQEIAIGEKFAKDISISYE